MSNSSPHPSTDSPLRVLYLEDHESMRIVTAERMRRAGYEVEDAPDGAEGWRKFCAATFDLVITDLQMPNLDGFTFIRLVRESKRPARIIVYSAAVTEPNLAVLRQLAVDASVHKISNWEVLRETIVAVMRSNP